MAGDQTSRLSAYLRFGCVSPTLLARWAKDKPGGEEFVNGIARIIPQLDCLRGILLW